MKFAVFILLFCFISFNGVIFCSELIVTRNCLCNYVLSINTFFDKGTCRTNESSDFIFLFNFFFFVKPNLYTPPIYSWSKRANSWWYQALVQCSMWITLTLERSVQCSVSNFLELFSKNSQLFWEIAKISGVLIAKVGNTVSMSWWSSRNPDY